MCTSVEDDETRAPDNVERRKVAPTINETPPPQPVGSTTSPESPMAPEAASVNSAGGAVVTTSVVSDQAPTIVRVDALAEPLDKVEVPLESADHPQSLSAPDQLGLDLGPTTMNSEAVSSSEAVTDPGPKDGKQTEVAAKSINSVQKTASNATSPETQAGTEVPVAHPMEEEPIASPTEAPAADAQEPSANTEPADTSRRSRKRTPSKTPAKTRQRKSATTKLKPSDGADP